ncbi:signal peptide protein [Actinoplanes sp. SE50]|uniref:putative bifunctional diguanylate cyclase/phosphodiesterase n=1 Tax=unclassified Actinoplanes TaxID=2626549 RepID=UPI00023ECCAF|nr:MULTISPECIES: EAL domain-containing protein [unclassified Actinoplanes]AEV84310.1 putative signaling protein [Actinoplanes sp. SE50/110]ATO82702.1 signal peptide protein [Actinoplanes sp. SE50]SLM00109.1 hypothetical protein ACSP50_3341 [Actinoplanes sp. SE50/110]
MTTGAVFCVALAVLPADSAPSRLIYYIIGAATVTAILTAVRRYRPADARSWYVLTAGIGAFVAGDVLFEAMVAVTGKHLHLWYNDGLYLLGYPVLWAGLLLVARHRGPRDRAGVIDAAIIATAVGLVYWVFLVEPTLGDRSTPLVERLVSGAYPTCDVLMLAVVVRMLSRPGGRTPSVVLLATGSMIMFLGEVFWTFSLSTNAHIGTVVNAGFVFSYVCWAGAALHPTMPAVATGGLGPVRFGWGRLATITAATLLVPAVLFAQGLRQEPVDWIAIGVDSVVLFLLVLTRLSGFVQQVQRQSARLEKLALHDDLTGLINRRGFEQRLVTAVAAGSVQVCLLDLDGFKSINDRLGHVVGDRLLSLVAERLATALPDADAVARMGGDEFAVLVPGAGTTEGDAIVARLTGALREPVHVDGHELLVSGSIGIADAQDTTDPVEVLRRADLAMYAAKAAGVRARRYTPDLDRRAGEEARIGAELRVALDEGQFHLLYQPIVDLPDGELRYVEALIRWDHPERGTVSPAVFIPVAERNGLIVELGEWILRTSCRQFMLWRREQAAGAPEKISVNVSARQLAEPNFAGLVADILLQAGMPAHHLLVEVTETAVFEGGVAVTTLEELHDLGVHIALDDFGTGHSSLTLLHTVPVDVLKVDKSFVDHVTMAGRHAVIATALIQVANGLGLIAVAEGVETAEQAAELHRLGYRLAQGYHFGRPSVEPLRGAAAAAR